MEELDELISRIKVPTTELKTDAIQEVMIKVQKLHRTTKLSEEFVNAIRDAIWTHLERGLENFDDQLLCSTCFFSVLILTEEQDLYLGEILKILTAKYDRTDNSKISQKISLMYGMFQSSYLLKVSDNEKQLNFILNYTCTTLISLAYDYAWYTFIVYKTINSFKKVIGTRMKDIVFTQENKIKLLNLVNHNWENPITGVRDMNKTIFQTLISVVDEPMYNLIENEINEFYWNKAKYLMLSEIISLEKKSTIYLLTERDWIEGLVNSLHKPGLVSAGADMYFAVLKSLRTDTEWCSIFLEKVLKVLTGSSNKAIENFTNYWCLTTFKKFPLLLSILMEEIDIVNSKRDKLYSQLCLMKQGNKLAILEEKWVSDKKIHSSVIQGLENNNVQIRVLAFDIVCVSYGKSLPSKLEYDLVCDYLSNNANSDSTVLRINMLSSFKSFLIRIHMSFLYNIKDLKKIEIDKDLQSFCIKIQELILIFLKTEGNYQRKITSIKLCEALFTYFTEVPKKRQLPTKSSNKSLLDIFKDNGDWILSEDHFTKKLIDLLQDPAEDVRENVAKILIQNYYKNFRNANLFNSLIQNALKSIKSKFFYEISCGQSMFKLIVNLLLKENQNDGEFRRAEDIFLYGCRELNNEFKLKRDIMESIEKGKQLHSFISILKAVLEVCQQNSYKLQDINGSVIIELLDNLNGISNQFAWEEQGSTISSDFSKMTEVVNNMIAKAGYNPLNESDHTKISGLHQIVLNCMWLNVKACCEVSSLLIRSYSHDCQAGVCGKSLEVITHVLETSRHKGAIEAAGAALGESIQHLTSLPKETELSRVPCTLLKTKLNELISEAGRMASVTRRGAGLSIMVHRIVASDMNKGKPLFHHFMKTLLTTCNKTEDVPLELCKNPDIDNEKDLPKAIYIHFLTRIVTDSSLASDLMHFSASLGELAFSNLTSHCWQIRNAALQLYGALVSKFLGQKKSSGFKEETIATVASDEFRTHMPELWQHILSQLDSRNNADIVQAHSDLVPVLNLLANSAKRYSFSYDLKAEEDSYNEMFQNLMVLLGSPIYTVRRLTASCIYNNFPFDLPFRAIKDRKFSSENMIHGCLLLTAIYFKHDVNGLNTDTFSELKHIFDGIISIRNHSYLSKAIYEDVFYVSEPNVLEKLEESFLDLQKNKYAPGIYLWVNCRVQKYLNEASWQDINEILKLLLAQDEAEEYCEYLHHRLLVNIDVPTEALQKISETLLTSDTKFSSCFLWKILCEIAPKIRVAKEDITVVSKYLKTKNFQVPYKLKYMIPFVASFIEILRDDSFVLEFTSLLFSLTYEDFEMRYIAAVATNALAHSFNKLADNMKIVIIRTIVILLQDEDEDIRSLPLDFIKIITQVQHAPHPCISLNKILTLDFLSSILSEPAVYIPVFCKDLTDVLKSYAKNCNNADEYNPFANDLKNIYIEIEVLKKHIEKLHTSYEVVII